MLSTTLFLLLLISRNSCYALIYLSPTARWNPNAMTVAGSSDGSMDSTLTTLASCSGIFMNTDDTLYIADSGNSRVVLVKPNSTRAIHVIQYAQDGSNLFHSPTDVFVTEKFIYVADSWINHVLKFFKNETNPTVIAGISGESTDTMNTSVISAPFNIFVDNHDQLYISDAYRSIVIYYASNSTGGSPGRIIAGSGTSGIDSTQLYWPRGIFVDEFGTLYVADSHNHRIQKWFRNASFGTTVAGNGISGNNLIQLNDPVAVVVDGNGYMYIVDRGNNRILRWPSNSMTGECIAACSGNGGIASNILNHPATITFDGLGNLFVSDQFNSRVQKFSIFSIPSTTATRLTATTETDSTVTLNTASMNMSTYPKTYFIILMFVYIYQVIPFTSDSFSF